MLQGPESLQVSCNASQMPIMCFCFVTELCKENNVEEWKLEMILTKAWSLLSKIVEFNF
jgi:hypothetical protein